MGKKPRIKEYHEPAGGWGAAKATAAVLLEQQVLFKGAAALYSMNKPGGFKCPSCAWPDPAPERADPLVILRERREGIGVGGDRQSARRLNSSPSIR